MHDQCSVSQMNIKLLSLNEENQNLEYTRWRHNMFPGPKKERGATIKENMIIYFETG